MTTDSARVYKLFKSHIKDILKRLNALEEAEKARLDAEHEELQQDEYYDDVSPPLLDNLSQGLLKDDEL